MFANPPALPLTSPKHASQPDNSNRLVESGVDGCFGCQIPQGCLSFLGAAGASLILLHNAAFVILECKTQQARHRHHRE